MAKRVSKKSKSTVAVTDNRPDVESAGPAGDTTSGHGHSTTQGSAPVIPAEKRANSPSAAQAVKQARKKAAAEQADQELITEGPRRAKTTALANAVWLQADGSGTRPRKRPAPATAATVSKKAKGKETPQRAQGQTTAQRGPVAPPAPRKPKARRVTKNTRATTGSHDDVTVSLPPIPPKTRKTRTSGREVTKQITVRHSEVEDDVDGSCTEEDTELADDESNGDQDESADEALEELKKKPTRLMNALVNERPTLNPSTSDGKRKASVIVRNQPIEISETESDEESSPTLQVQGDHKPKPKGLLTLLELKRGHLCGCADITEANIMLASESQEDDNNSFLELSSSVTEEDSGFESVEWPAFTLIRYNETGKINLTKQQIELKLVLRRAITIVEGQIIFENAFADLGRRAVWKRKALLEATSYVMNMPNTAAKRKYVIIKNRLKEDSEYVSELSKVLEVRISGLRKNFKQAASMAILSEFGLKKGCGDVVRALVRDMQFIYPTTPNGGPLVGSPYQNQAIISVIKYELFCVKSIVKRYPKQFANKKEVTPPVLAFAATAIRAALDEWVSGERRPAVFSADSYTDIYKDHLDFMKHRIEKENLVGYAAMLHRVYRFASDGVASALNHSALFNASAMVVEIDDSEEP
ncbi:hypothetical protein F5887DRAFT_1069211 [Amanita rubescens]|nr:hypothetical protein F5887DRAFT_1069211 [Amanita rubescens]